MRDRFSTLVELVGAAFLVAGVARVASVGAAEIVGGIILLLIGYALA